MAGWDLCVGQPWAGIVADYGSGICVWDDVRCDWFGRVAGCTAESPQSFPAAPLLEVVEETVEEVVEEEEGWLARTSSGMKGS